MEFVEREFVLYPEHNNQGAGNTGGQPNDVDKEGTPVQFETAEHKAKVAEKHSFELIRKVTDKALTMTMPTEIVGTGHDFGQKMEHQCPRLDKM